MLYPAEQVRRGGRCGGSWATSPRPARSPAHAAQACEAAPLATLPEEVSKRAVVAVLCRVRSQAKRERGAGGDRAQITEPALVPRRPKGSCPAAQRAAEESTGLAGRLVRED